MEEIYAESSRSIFRFSSGFVGPVLASDSDNDEDEIHNEEEEYSTSDECSTSDEDEFELPSKVTDRHYIFMPPVDEDDEMSPQQGKWMLFAHDDVQLLDEFWTRLLPLQRNGSLVRLKASTAMDFTDSGVVNCYTADSENAVDVKRAADAIRGVVHLENVMYYKTNLASAEGQYLRNGSRTISKYMHTCENVMYERDELKRWKLVSA